jgi:hypothetical protein
MKRIIVTSLLVVMALTLGVMPALAQGTISTAFAVQNLGDQDADITVEFRSASGALTGSIYQRVGPGGLYNFDQRYDSGNPGQSPFQGSAIVSASQPVGAVVNMMRRGGEVESHESYNGLADDQIGTNIVIPQILRNISSAGLVWNTTISVQNTNTSASVDVQILYIPDPIMNATLGGTLTQPYTQTLTLAAGATRIVDQAVEPTQIGAKFFGSARVYATGPVGVSAYSDGSGRVLMAYPTFTSGTTNAIALPSIYKNIMSLGNSYSTAILIANLGSSEAQVEIRYLATSGIGTVSGVDTVTVPVNGARNVDQRYTDGHAPSITSDRFMGGAVVRSTNGQPIAVMVNLRGGSRYGMTYAGISQESSVSYLPIAYRGISSFGNVYDSTPIVFNPADTAVSVRFTFYRTNGQVIADPTWYPVEKVRQFDLRYVTALTNHGSFIGSIKIETSDGRPIRTMVQTRGSGGATGDVFMSYLGLTRN